MIHRTITLAACAVFLGSLLLSGLPAAEKKKDEPKKKVDKKAEAPTKLTPLFAKNEELKSTDDKDTKLKQSPRRVFPIAMSDGKVYQIDLKSKDFDTYLRLENAAGEEVAFNDDADVNTLDSRIVYKASKAGDYKIIVTRFDNQVGKFSLSVAEVTGKAVLLTGSRFKGEPIKLTFKDGKASYTGELVEADPANFSHYYKLFSIELEKDKSYRIVHRDAGKDSKFDPYLVLEDAVGAMIAADDDSGGKLDARIDFKAPKAGVFRVIATTLEKNQTGRFMIEVSIQPEGTKDKKRTK